MNGQQPCILLPYLDGDMSMEIYIYMPNLLRGNKRKVWMLVNPAFPSMYYVVLYVKISALKQAAALSTL